MFTYNKIDQESVVICTGKTLDNGNAHEMTETISQAQEAGYKNVVLDMSQLDFISSAGVGSILGSLGVARQMGGDIILCQVCSNVLHIFEILDLCGYLTIVSDQETARELCLKEG